MKLGVKLMLSFLSVIAILLILSGVAIKNLDAMNSRVNEIDSTWLPAVITVQSMNIQINAVRADLAAIMSQNYADEIRKYETRIQQSLQVLQENRERLLTLMQSLPGGISKQDKELIERIDALSAEAGEIRESLVKGMLNGRRGMAVSNFDSKYRPVFEKMAEAYGELLNRSVNGSQQAAGDASSIGEQARATSLILAGVGLMCAVGICLLLTRSVSRQLGKDPGQLALVARRVAGGDYHMDDDGSRRGVYGDIVAMVEALKSHIERARQESEKALEQSHMAAEALHKAETSEEDAKKKTAAMLAAAHKLEQVAQAVSAASTQLSVQIEQSDKGAVASAQRLAEAASAMNQMNATVHNVAHNAAQASTASHETREKAVAGAHIVEQAVHSIGQVHEVSLRLTENMGQLNTQAQAISNIMNVISDIADQTNLLALNAAIEAARAGEAGRGFAVVADEVRKLAEKTMTSTHDVGSAIKAIQESTAKSVAAMDLAAAQVDNATGFANQSGQALGEIVTTVEGTADQVNAIAAASEQQSVASEEINRSISTVNDAVQQTAQAMNEASRAVGDLARQTRTLTSLIAEMRNEEYNQ
ncbi:MAG: methyl-accepting chemotaxis protein [Desulfovibrio sp.]|uniref:methyl-accepting chemotaxis protein n=1 Tax=Desulfovibrio sp. TaxID=885 RepID=UPI0039E54E81